MTPLCNVYANNIKDIIYVITRAGSYKSQYASFLSTTAPQAFCWMNKLQDWRFSQLSF